jgi:hypothetical protein
MSTYREYQNYNPNISFWTNIRKNNGSPNDGKDVRVEVIDAEDNSLLLTDQAMPNVSNGYYKYNWTPTFSQNKSLFAMIYIRINATRREIIDTIDITINNIIFDREEKIDENDGQAI